MKCPKCKNIVYQQIHTIYKVVCMLCGTIYNPNENIPIEQRKLGGE